MVEGLQNWITNKKLEILKSWKSKGYPVGYLFNLIYLITQTNIPFVNCLYGAISFPVSIEVLLRLIHHFRVKHYDDKLFSEFGGVKGEFEILHQKISYTKTKPSLTIVDINFKTKEVICKILKNSFKNIDKELLERTFNKSLGNYHLLEGTKNLIYFKLESPKDSRYNKYQVGSYDRLERILIDMKANVEFVSYDSTDNQDTIYLTTSLKIKTLTRELTNIEHKFGIKKGYLTIDDNLGVVCFKIRKTQDKLFDFDTVMQGINKPQEMILPLLIGVEISTGKAIVKDLTKLTHILIGGMTNTGKSCTLVSMLDSLLFWNFDNVILFVSDFKENMLVKYHNVANCEYIEPSEKGLMEMYKILLIEYNNRKDVFKSVMINQGIHCPDIHTYNKLNPSIPFPYIVVAIDEINTACQMEFKDIETSNMNFDNIRAFFLSKSRSVGIHFIDSVQKATTDQYRKKWRCNIEVRLCHKMSESSESDYVLQSSKEDSQSTMNQVKGEFFFKDELSEIKKMKGCLVSEDSRIFQEIKKQKREVEGFNISENNIISIKAKKN